MHNPQFVHNRLEPSKKGSRPIGQTSEQRFSLQQGDLGLFIRVSIRSEKGARKSERKAPVGQKSLHQNRGIRRSSRSTSTAIKVNSTETVRSFTRIIASVLNMPGALT
jgi:hypothetical protein